MIDVRDVVIIGGGPAGLAAALVLGRSCKRVTVLDDEAPRNTAAPAVHGFLTRDGIAPRALRVVARADLDRYASVEVLRAHVESIAALEDGGFSVRHASGVLRARKILLCAGLVDELPDVPNFRELWAKSIFQCPYCHAWEVRDRRYAYWPHDERDFEHALLLRGWTSDLVVFSRGLPVSDEIRRTYARAQIGLDERAVIGLRALQDQLTAVEVEGGEVERDVLFVSLPNRPPPLVAQLGLRMFDENSVFLSEDRETSVPGIYAAGDLVNPVHSALIAAASAVAVAYKINTVLTRELLLGHEKYSRPSPT